MTNLFRRIFDGMCCLSTKPDLTAYKWSRRTRSLFASILLWVIWFLRFFSLLQWVKLIYRKLATTFKLGYTENSSGRPDVPPVLGELYFLFFTLLFGFTHYNQLDGTLIKTVAIYYLFESSIWILYYTVFRRFFELGYTIYHQLEYILTIIVIVPTQALCFSLLYRLTLKNAFLALIGSGDSDSPTILVLFGFLLTAITISMIISTFPNENIKKCRKKAKMIIIGCGDVVKKRLFPSLSKCEHTIDISVYDLDSATNILPNCTTYENQEAIINQLNKINTNGCVAWIATPPNSHVDYVSNCLKQQFDLIAVEKPITTNFTQIETINKLTSNSSNRKRLFFLSYYVLEKSLPLTYLAYIAKNNSTRTNFYAKYLDIGNSYLVNHWNDLLGDITNIDIHIKECTDERTWLLNSHNRMHLYETFLHNVLITMQFCDFVNGERELDIVNCSITNGNNNFCEIYMNAKYKDTNINLIVQKNAPNQNRLAKLHFAHGSITMDFSSKSAEIYFEQLNTYTEISIKNDFTQNYNVLVDMVCRVLSNEASSSNIDGLDNQIEALKWIHKLDNKLSDNNNTLSNIKI